MTEFHRGGVVRGSGRIVQLADDECVLARRAAADGAIVCIRADDVHRALCTHDAVAFTTDIDATIAQLRRRLSDAERG